MKNPFQAIPEGVRRNWWTGLELVSDASQQDIIVLFRRRVVGRCATERMSAIRGMVPTELQAAQDVFPEVILKRQRSLGDFGGAQGAWHAGGGIFATGVHPQLFCELI